MASAWPSDDLTVAALDENTDTLTAARVELYNAVQKLKTVLDTRNANSGVCGLDANGYVGVSQLRVGLCGKATMNAGHTVASGSWTSLQFDAEAFDDASFFDLGTYNTRVTIPANVSRVRISAQACWVGDQSSTGTRMLRLRRNGSFGSEYWLPNHHELNPTTTSLWPIVQNVSGIFSVSAADYFEAVMYQDSGSTLTIDAGVAYVKPFLSIEVLAS